MIFISILIALINFFFMYYAPYIIGAAVITLVIGAFTRNGKESSPHRGQRISAPKNS